MNAIVEGTSFFNRNIVSKRRIRDRTQGSNHGGLTRLVSPSDLGNLIKPFVFLDYFDVARGGSPMNMHPHSGIATMTVPLSGKTEYHDSTGKQGILPAGGVEWMSAGGGVWHGGGIAGNERMKGYQLWVALPPEDENGPAYSRYLPPEQVPSSGPARIILGRYGQAESLIRTRTPMNYLHVSLKDGERWRYQPPAGHTVAWVATHRGKLRTANCTLQNEIAVFEESSQAIDFGGDGDTEFVLGSSIRHPHELALGYYSVHTSPAALARGEAEIRRIGRQIESENILNRKRHLRVPEDSA
ncbi:pirin family protein [Nitrosovibrio tenuis]|uniref:Redox-sensitive bicupin YhaK, pirin superfamily n=1 Tax=Nitrosovibrio tenuis TaxID=1233 RepID=A0A1H7PGM1_9PROT|nr:pirin family protein [Nitrosovibrio tenuis]SEL34207.1 Redox-sensitive bicupin YhaK, pirin superfamily [Nitrosovibrio tenuis]